VKGLSAATDVKSPHFGTPLSAVGFERVSYLKALPGSTEMQTAVNRRRHLLQGEVT